MSESKPQPRRNPSQKPTKGKDTSSIKKQEKKKDNRQIHRPTHPGKREPFIPDSMKETNFYKLLVEQGLVKADATNQVIFLLEKRRFHFNEALLYKLIEK